MSGSINYSKRRLWKYKLETDVVYDIGICIKKPHSGWFITLDTNGVMRIRANYCWDGPSGPTFDTPSFMRGSLYHDAIYQLIRQGVLSMDDRDSADRLIKRVCLEDGMGKIRAWAVYRALKLFGKKAAMPNILTAPK